MIGLKEKDCEKKKKRKVEFYTHGVVTTPQDRSSRCRILHNDFISNHIYCVIFGLFYFAAVVEGRRSDFLKVATAFVTVV